MAGINQNTKLMLHMNGADTSTTFTDDSGTGKSMTAVGNAQIDTAQSVFGGASGLFDGNGDYVSTPNSADFNFGTSDFTIDFRIRLNADANMDIIGNGYTTGFMCQYVTSLSPDRLRLWLVGTNYDFTQTLNTATWYHIAFTRNGTNLRCFVNGTQTGSTLTSSDNITNSNELRVGVDVDDPGYTNGWLDELRIQKGEAVWTANFTSPTGEYTRDALSGFLTPRSKFW